MTGVQGCRGNRGGRVREQSVEMVWLKETETLSEPFW